jgi:hypothetical protein
MDEETLERITTDTAPQPSGHYAQATAWGELIAFGEARPARSNMEAQL